MTRLYFKDSTYMDMPDDIAKLYENQPDWDHSERFDANGNLVEDSNDDDVE